MYWNKTKLPRLINDFGADIYHSFKQITNFRSNAKTIFTIHSAFPFLYPQYLNLQEKLYWVPMYRKVGRHADGIISVSHTDAANLARFIPDLRNKLHITQLAADERFSPVDDPNAVAQVKRKLNLPDRFMLYVGSFYPVKNVTTVVEVFHRIRNEHGQGIKLVLVGRRGWGSDEVIERITKYGLREHVVLCGNQFEYLPHIYTLASLFLFPSHYEAFCAPPLEAMACGTPVIASNRGGIPEVVGEAALLSAPDDIAGLTHDCLRVLDNNGTRDALVQCGFQQSKRHTWDKCAMSTISVYEKL